jgi:SAM-dependent methyltransferase
MSSMQPLPELEKWWENKDPWNYEKHADDEKRKGMLLYAIPRKDYKRVLDIGCGNGFITKHLPGKEIIGADVSANAIQHARENSQGCPHIKYLQHSIFDLPFLGRSHTFDLIVITGVFYPQYIAKSEKLIYAIVDDLLINGGILVSCHIDAWYTCRFPYVTLLREYYEYREYNHILEVYVK